ncbi:MAG: glycosyltransferase family 2 protein [Polyangiales bacterium]
MQGRDACAIVPALDAAKTITGVVTGALPHVTTVIVVDDGSTDGTADLARSLGATITVHEKNRGKGAALKTGLALAQDLGFRVAVTLDADGQHPPSEIPKLLSPSDEGALVLGVRDLAAAGAPIANQRSNAFANGFISCVTLRRIGDTQCGMRRYPVSRTLALGVKDDRFGFETEVILRANRARMPIVQVPIEVRYPSDRTTHFDARRDPWRIVGRVLRTLLVDR